MQNEVLLSLQTIIYLENKVVSSQPVPMWRYVTVTYATHTGTAQHGEVFMNQPSQGYFLYWWTLNFQRRKTRLPELHKLFPFTIFVCLFVSWQRSETGCKSFAIQNWVMQRNTVPMHWNNGTCETFLPRNYKQKLQPSLNSVQLYTRVNFIQLSQKGPCLSSPWDSALLHYHDTVKTQHHWFHIKT